MIFLPDPDTQTRSDRDSYIAPTGTSVLVGYQPARRRSIGADADVSGAPIYGGPGPGSYNIDGRRGDEAMDFDRFVDRQSMRYGSGFGRAARPTPFPGKSGSGGLGAYLFARFVECWCSCWVFVEQVQVTTSCERISWTTIQRID